MKKLSALSFLFLILALSLILSGCGGTSIGNPILSEDSSTSGAVAAAVGGALSSSASNGSQAFFQQRNSSNLFATLFNQDAWASIACPTVKTIGTGCTSSANTLWLTYNNCSFGSSSAVWKGVKALISSTPVSCGTFPNPGANGSLIQQFVTSANSTSPSAVTITSSFGTSTVVDHVSANLSNFDLATINPLVNGGYGIQTQLNSSGVRSGLTIAERLVSRDNFDHSITGNLTLSENADGISRGVSGVVTVYYNGLQLIANSTLKSVTHSDSCCLPTSGSIVTQFSASNSPSRQPRFGGAAYVGKSETLTFTGCGTATLLGFDGSSSSVSLSRCF